MTTATVAPVTRTTFRGSPPLDKPAPLPKVVHSAKKRIRWTSADWIVKARDAIERYQARHLADLLATLRLPFTTSRCWAVGSKKRTLAGEVYTLVKPKPGWLKATADVPRPRNHELHVLRYLNHTTLDAITARRTEIEATGASEIEALRQAVDEIVGAARKAGEERRAARRREKFGGVDPVPVQRLTQEERDEKRVVIKARRAPFLAKNRSKLRKRSAKVPATTARLRRIKRAKIKAVGGRKGLAKQMLEAKRKERWQKAAARLYGVKSFQQVPQKTLYNRV